MKILIHIELLTLESVFLIVYFFYQRYSLSFQIQFSFNIRNDWMKIRKMASKLDFAAIFS